MKAVAIETEAQRAGFITLADTLFMDTASVFIARVFSAGNSVITGGEVDAFIGDAQVFSTRIVIVAWLFADVTAAIITLPFDTGVTLACGAVTLHFDGTLSVNARNFRTAIGF